MAKADAQGTMFQAPACTWETDNTPGPQLCSSGAVPFALETHPVHSNPGHAHLHLCWQQAQSWSLGLSLPPQSDLSSLPEIENALAVFCMATYGEGDPTDNAQDFYDWLQEADVDLSGVKYAVSHPCCDSLWNPMSKEPSSSVYLVLISQGRLRCQDGLQAHGLVGNSQGDPPSTLGLGPKSSSPCPSPALLQGAFAAGG